MVSIWEKEHVAGWVHPLRLGNTFFTGMAGGFMDSLLGFSLYASIASGVSAARAIARGQSFEQGVAPLRKNMLNALSLRRSIDRFEQDDLDRLVAALVFPGLRDIVYHSRFNVIGAAATAAAWYRVLKAHVRPCGAARWPGRLPPR